MGASRMGQDMSIPALPRSSHAKPKKPWVRSMPVHSAATAGIAHQLRHQEAGQRCEHCHVQSLVEAEQDERAPSAPRPHATVNVHDEFDPGADAAPEDHTCRPSIKPPAFPGSFARAGDQYRRERDRRQPSEIKTGE